MKTFALFVTLLTTTLAAPTTSPATVLEERLLACPTSSLLPTGQLPPGAIAPSALIKISRNNPNRAYPNNGWPKITPRDDCTIFNFTISASAAQGKLCNIAFNIPPITGVIFRYTFLGRGHFTFKQYRINAGATAGVTTWNTQPLAGSSPVFNLPTIIQPSNSYVISSAPCKIAANLGRVTLSGVLCSNDTSFVFRQSSSSCPTGLFVILTDDPSTKK
ncbi:hypothetical protein P154DRAFT_432208 [Amniculicola lignicola CBS 123094]|uniref:Ubiquitin 3 binding protein But2 C-terminal domain-containing protein n=1 Tax=Amniculicola lignicola CBS 123094 TaxID=1392246 RepID=A0A6A5WIQ4_9PLEO|nr:hypothetical protein P154DRAFT_432208 [Amniculicola lignicola CBS 123094]